MLYLVLAGDSNHEPILAWHQYDWRQLSIRRMTYNFSLEMNQLKEDISVWLFLTCKEPHMKMSAFCLCFMDCLMVFYHQTAYTLRVNCAWKWEKSRKGGEWKCYWVFYRSKGRFNLSHKVTQIEHKCLHSASRDRILKFTGRRRKTFRIHHCEWDTYNGSQKGITMFWVCFITFTGDVVLAGCGEASAAVAVDGCNPELIPALRPQIG